MTIRAAPWRPEMGAVTNVPPGRGDSRTARRPDRGRTVGQLGGLVLRHRERPVLEGHCRPGLPPPLRAPHQGGDLVIHRRARSWWRANHSGCRKARPCSRSRRRRWGGETPGPGRRVSDAQHLAAERPVLRVGADGGVARGHPQEPVVTELQPAPGVTARAGRVRGDARDEVPASDQSRRPAGEREAHNSDVGRSAEADGRARGSARAGLTAMPSTPPSPLTATSTGGR